MFSRPKFNKSLILTVTISAVYIVIMMLLNHKGFWFNREIILWLTVIKLLRFGTFDFVGIIGQSSSALILGIVFCWLLKKGKTIWNPIIVHAIYDLMYVLLVGGA